MRLRSDTPSSVRLLGYYVRVFYARQPRTCFQCGQLGHQAAECSEVPAAPVNLFREEDFPPLPQGVDSGDEEVRVPFAAAAAPPPPSASPGEPPVVAVLPPGDVVPSVGLPAPVTVLPVPESLPGAPCAGTPSSPASSAAPPDLMSVPQVPDVLGAGVDPALLPVPGLVPHVVEDAAVLRRASVRPASVAHVSESASGSDDVRPEPKRSQHSSQAWADVGEFGDCGSSGGGEVAPGVLPTTVVAEVHLLEDAGTGVPASASSMVSVAPASGASPATDGSGSTWEVVPPAEVRGERGGLVVVLRKDAHSGGSETPSSVSVSSAAVLPPLPSPAVSSVSPAVSVEVLPSRQPSPVPVHTTARRSRLPSSACSVSSASSQGVVGTPRPR
ncbi:calphotin-like [Procambarus clarkii]|uniref:calphotin-like n=1 Tax=Procambarus clarkii TaxID=6728 RepID=UPI0037431617